MRRLMLMIGFGLAMIAATAGAAIVNNSGSVAADSISLGVFNFDSAGYEPCSADSFYAVVTRPGGDSVFAEAITTASGRIVSLVVGGRPQYVYRAAVADIDGAGGNGVYTLTVWAVNSDSGLTFPNTMHFQLYTPHDIDSIWTYAGDTTTWASVADVWRNIDTTDVDTSLIGEWLVSAIGGGSSNWSNDQRDSVLAAMTATAWLAKTWPAGVITAARFASDAITATVIADGAIDAGAIASSAITSAKFATDAITAAVIGDGAIDAGAIATNAIGASEIADNAIDAGAIAADAIGASEIATNAIGAAEIADDAIDAGAIAAGAIGASEIATDAIGADEIAANAITSTELADNAITAAKIATAAIGADEIATDAIGAAEVADGAIDAGAIATDAITAAKIAADAIGASEIAASAIGASEIATDAIGAEEIAASAIGASEIATDAIGADEIAADAIGAAELAANAIGADEIAPSAVDSGALAPSVVSYLNRAPLAAIDTSRIAAGYANGSWSFNHWGYEVDSTFIGFGDDTIYVIIVKHPPDSGYYPDSTRVTGY